MRLRRYVWLLIANLAITGAEAVPAGSHCEDTIIPRIHREPVPSAAIATIGYSKRLQILEIEFLNGAIYRYTEVPRSVHQELMSAKSKTHYYLENIKGNYPSTRIRKWQTREASN